MSSFHEVREYDIFTRLQRGDDLTKIGTIEAPDDEIATVYAQKIYDEQDWSEMIVVRRDQLIEVRKPQGLFAQEGVN